MISFARIALFAAVVAAIEAQSDYFSSNTTTPHYSSSECRIRNSTICDPENVLDDNTLELRQLVSSIAAITNRGCASNNYVPLGFKVGIAVVKSLPPTGSNYLQMIELIARRVHAKWQLGTCGESIIIASAAAPYNVVYVVAENLAGSSFLSSIRTILDSSRPFFAQSQKIGLQYVLLQIQSVLQSSKLLPGYPVLTSNQNAALTSAADSTCLSTSGLVLPVIALAYVLN